MANEKRLIDVNKVINSMQQCLDENPDDKGSIAYTAYELIIGCLKQEPTVDAVEVVHGRFVDAECSVCRWFGNIVETRHYNYCPNCGAKMDGDGNG